MSTVVINDKRGGVFEVMVTFTYGECARLPFNSLRKVNARLDQVPTGGLKATAQFNLRNSAEAAHFVEMLDLFGEDGSYVHGSPADPDELKKEEVEDDEEPGLWAATAGSAQTESVESSPKIDFTPPAVETAGEDSQPALDEELQTEEEDPATDEDESYEVDEEDTSLDEGVDLEMEEEAPLPPSEADTAWERAGDDAVAISIRESEDRAETLARVAEAAGEAYTVDMVRHRLIEYAYFKFKDVKYVVSFLQLRGWNDLDEDEVTDILTQ